jgi:hypothetical protein
MGFHQIKKVSAYQRKQLSRVKRQFTEWAKVFASYLSDKDFLFCFVLVAVLGFELRASCLLGRCLTRN